MARFRDPGSAPMNCAQTVVLFVSQCLGIDLQAITVARYMGGGSVGMGETCGAVEGAVTSLGLRDYFAPDEHPAMAPDDKQALQQLIRDFREEFGSATCRGLTGCDISSAEGYAPLQAR